MSQGDQPEPSLTVAAVARRLGVAPATLRTWDRRYGLGPSEHLAGAHRRYTTSDVARLLTMRRLTLEGVAPSEAARAARVSGARSEGPDPAGPSTAEVLDAYTDAVQMAPDPAALAAAAVHFDNAAVRWMLARVHPRSVLDWWTELVEPALDRLGDRVGLERPGESAVRGLEAAAFAELRSRVAAADLRLRAAPAVTAPVLALPIGRAPDLVLHVLATALHDNGVPARVLVGAGAAAVGQAVRELGPAAVLLHAGRTDDEEHSTRASELVATLARTAPDLPVFVHREGSTPLDVPPAPSLHRVRSLPGALYEVLAVVG